MVNLKQLQLSLLAVLTMALPASAQRVFQSARPQSVVMKMSPADRLRTEADFRLSYPHLFNRLSHRPDQTVTPGMRLVPTAADEQPVRVLKAAELPTEMWGAVAWANNWSQSYYDFCVAAFDPTSPVALSKQGSVDDRIGDRGTAVVNGKYYAMTADFTLAAYGYVYAQLYVYDTDTWQPLAKSDDGLQNAYTITDYSLIALETAQAQDGTVYGEFYSADLNAREWGIIDYEKQTRTTIGPAQREYIALGVTSQNRLYGIALDGNLYEISTTDGTETLIGHTGVKTIVNNDNQFYTQSGEIDPKTNTFYWEHINVNTARSALYTVDLATGHATYVADLPNSTWLYGLLVPQPSAEADAPARAANLEASFVDASTTGTISFTAPSATYAGQPLSGLLDYQVLVGNTVLATGQVEAGTKATATVTAPEGDVQFTVVTSNAVGLSPRAKLSHWVGFDVPRPATDVRLNVSGQDATVSWTAPTEGVHGAYMGQLTYDVYRSVLFEDTVLVAQNHTATTLSTRIPDGGLKTYTYIVYVNNGNRQSIGENSNGVISGSAIEPPYHEYFNSSDDFFKYTVKNYGDPDATWTYNDQLHCVWSYNVYGTDNDAWLITPFVHLQQGMAYTLSFHAMNGLPAPNDNTFEVLYGQGDDEKQYTALTATLCPPFAWTEYTTEFTAEADGAYKFAFHDNTVGHHYRILLDSISIVPNGQPTAPDSVTSLSLLPGERGALRAALVFKAPERSIGGSALTVVDSLFIERNDTLIATLREGYRPGQQLTFEDNSISTAGFYRYSIVACTAGEKGRMVKTQRMYIGLDVPADPQHVRLLDHQSCLHVTWDAISGRGVNGGFVDPATTNVEVNTIEYDTWGRTMPGQQMGLVTGATSLDIAMNTDEGQQDLQQYIIRSFNDAGSQGYVYTEGIITGQAYTLPYSESFAKGGASTFVWVEKGVIGPSTNLSDDNDGGCVYWTSMNRDADACLSLGKLSLAGATKPILTFAYYAHQAADPMQLKIQAYKPDGTLVDLQTFDLAEATAAGWMKGSVDLTSLKGERYVVLKFRPVCTVAASGEQGQIGIDNINIRDAKANDLAVEVTDYTRQATKGQTVGVDVKVTNYGQQPAANYTVNIYADGELADSRQADKALAPFTSQTYNFRLKTTSLHEADVMEVKAEVVSVVDEQADNDVATVPVTLETTIMPAPASISVSDGEQTGVDVSWTEPVAIPMSTTEDFERYDPWARTFGNWTLVDADKGFSCPFFSDQSNTTPLDYTQYAMAIFNPEAIFEGCTEANPFLAAHSGRQYACAIYQIDQKSNFINADNWLISPQLSGEAQTISFFVHNVVTTDGAYVEQFEVLASQTDSALGSFTKIGESNTLASGEWEEMAFSLPEGTRYFAIHHITDADNTFMFSIDDVTFRILSEAPVAYNVYRDGQLAATAKAGARLLWNDAERLADGLHVYAVTAVYADGSESAPVQASIETSGIRTTDNGQLAADDAVYDLQGRRIANAQMKKGVYIMGSQKIVKK